MENLYRRIIRNLEKLIVYQCRPVKGGEAEADGPGMGRTLSVGDEGRREGRKRIGEEEDGGEIKL